MRKPGSTIIDGKKKPVAGPDNRKPLSDHNDVEAKRAAQASNQENREVGSE